MDIGNQQRVIIVELDKERLLDNWDKYMAGEKGKAYFM